jgi:hypothetical protein
VPARPRPSTATGRYAVVRQHILRSLRSEQKQADTSGPGKPATHLLSWRAPYNQKIERAIEYIDSDEFVEATPKSPRLRKRILDATARERMSANIILNAARGAVSVPN